MKKHFFSQNMDIPCPAALFLSTIAVLNFYRNMPREIENPYDCRDFFDLNGLKKIKGDW